MKRIFFALLIALPALGADRLHINVGNESGDLTGDGWRTGLQKSNTNFVELFNHRDKIAPIINGTNWYFSPRVGIGTLSPSSIVDIVSQGTISSGFSDVSSANSGTVGWYLDKPAERAIPHGIIWRISGAPRWEVGMDYENYDMVLLYTHDTTSPWGTGDMFRVSPNRKFILGPTVGSPTNELGQLTIARASGRAGLRIKEWSGTMDTADAISIERLGDAGAQYIAWNQGNTLSDFRIGMVNNSGIYAWAVLAGDGASPTSASSPGPQALVVTRDRKLGVNTGGPLHIIDADYWQNSNSYIRIRNSNTNNSARAGFVASGEEGHGQLHMVKYSSSSSTGAEYQNVGFIYMDGDSPLLLGTVGQRAIHIDTNRWVGIGRVPGDVFDVDTSMRVTRAVSTFGPFFDLLKGTSPTRRWRLQVDADGSDNSHLFFRNSSDADVMILSQSGVGIGGTAPSYPLDVQKTADAITTMRIKNPSSGSSARAELLVEGEGGHGSIHVAKYSTASSTGAEYQNTGFIYTDADSPLLLGTVGQRAIHIDTNRWVGIGRVPGDVFDVDTAQRLSRNVGTFGPYLDFYKGTPSPTRRWRIQVDADGADNSKLMIRDGNDVDALTLSPGGNVASAGSFSGVQFIVSGTTNQVIFGATNTAPASPSAPVKWISVQIQGEATEYRLPLYQ